MGGEFSDAYFAGPTVRYTAPGIGRQTLTMLPGHRSQAKNLLVRCDPQPLGFFWKGARGDQS